MPKIRQGLSRIVCLFLWLGGFAVGPVFSAPASPEASWKVVAGRDAFSDESYFMIVPLLPDGDGQIARRYWSEVSLDYGYFLRPFVAIDNGILVVGVTVWGEAATKVSPTKTQVATSGIAVGTVQLRVDAKAPVEIDPFHNPPIHLPGFAAAAEDSPDQSERMRAKDPRSIDRSLNYAAMTGEPASEFLDALVNGSSVIIRRKATAELTELKGNALVTKIFQLGAEFKRALDRVGLRKNPTTGKWELDPAKENDRASLISAK